LDLFNIRQKPLVMLPLALLSGIAVASCVPFFLQLAYCPLYPTTVFGALGLSCLLLNIRGVARGYGKWPRINRNMAPRLRIKMYELPFILIVSFLVFVSVWRCYYQPPFSRDALSGPEAIAEYAVREHTLINSFFTAELSTTNNQFKSPFLISLQVIYKMAGYPFGQIWLSVVFISYTLLVYQVLKATLHPILAGLLLLLMTAAPEIYAYTFLILYDYSNMVFFFLSLYFLFDSFENKRRSYFYFAALLMGIAAYIRSETLVLAALFAPVLWIRQRRDGQSFVKMIWAAFVFLLPALVSYYLTIRFYINHYLPVHYDIAALVNSHPFNLRPLLGEYRDIFKKLIISEYGIHLWGYIMFVWAGIFLADLVILRRLNRAACNWLYAIGIVFAGLGLLGFLLPLFELEYTAKRGLFKIVPLIVMYMANSQLLIRLSARISQWEQVRSAR
jgi:hypothetical protein